VPVNTGSRSFARGEDLMRRHLDRERVTASFTLLGQEWTLLPDVFAPTLTPVTELFSTWIPYPVGGTFLELGSGAGVTAVVAAEAGCAAVTAVDISPVAVEDTLLNVRRHRVGDRVRVLRSDLFGALDPEERFDAIFWNSNFVEPPPGFVNQSVFHHAFFDPDYSAHRRFARDGPGRLTERGRFLLGFSDLGNRDLLDEICAEAGLRIVTLAAETRQTEIRIEFQLLELKRAA
jgi:methylase of polypeptide subunit release factors